MVRGIANQPSHFPTSSYGLTASQRRDSVEQEDRTWATAQHIFNFRFILPNDISLEWTNYFVEGTAVPTNQMGQWYCIISPAAVRGSYRLVSVMNSACLMRSGDGKGPIGRFVTLFQRSRWGKVLPIMMSSGQIRHSYGKLSGRQMMDWDETRLSLKPGLFWITDQQPLGSGQFNPHE